RRGKHEDRHRDPERTADRIALERLAVGQQARGRDDDPEREENAGEQPRRRSWTEGKAAHAGKIAGGPESKERKRDERQSAIKILRIADHAGPMRAYRRVHVLGHRTPLWPPLLRQVYHNDICLTSTANRGHESRQPGDTAFVPQRPAAI